MNRIRLMFGVISFGLSTLGLSHSLLAEESCSQVVGKIASAQGSAAGPGPRR